MRFVFIVLLPSLVACGVSDRPARVPLAVPNGSFAPHLVAHDGQIVLSLLAPAERGDEAMALRAASYGPGGWGSLVTIAEGDDWFLNWADFPAVVPISARRWIAHWLVRQPAGGYAYDVMLAESQDGGASWSAPRLAHHDGTPTEHGFVSVYAEREGFGAVWLDGREMAEAGPMQLRSGSWPNGTAGESTSEIVDPRVCECCQTDAAAVEDGLVVVYRDRTEVEVRDIFAARRIDGVWQPPVRVSRDDWLVRGCPVNGPAVDARGDEVVVAWFDGAQGSRVQVAFSDDGGRSFGEPIRIAGETSLGRVDVALLDGGQAAVSWLARAPGELRTRRVTRRGELGAVLPIAPMMTQRNAGFPQMVLAGEDLLYAWTHLDANGSEVRTAVLALAHLP